MKLSIWELVQTNWFIKPFQTGKIENDQRLLDCVKDFLTQNKIFHLPESSDQSKSFRFYCHDRNNLRDWVCVLRLTEWIELMSEVWNIPKLDLYDRSFNEIFLQYPQLKDRYVKDIQINPFRLADQLYNITNEIHCVSMDEDFYENFFNCLPPISYGLNYVFQSEPNDIRQGENTYGLAFKADNDQYYCTNITRSEFAKRQWYNYKKVNLYMPEIEV